MLSSWLSPTVDDNYEISMKTKEKQNKMHDIQVNPTVSQEYFVESNLFSRKYLSSYNF